mmetsp:Transcript_2246/g.3536  ORF Transcript_2246/g.3536 Transcript_2246/m.3536 type:complete len:207 (+) Transcript_2246:29-649(+)
MSGPLKILYFPFNGRAFAAQTCLKIGGIEFVDEKCSFSELSALRGESGMSEDIPYGSVPVMTLPSGEKITQSMAIARYCAKLAKLYPEDFEKAVLVDEIMAIVEDMLGSCPKGPPDADEKKRQREEWAKEKLTKFFTFVASKLAKRGPYVTGGVLTVADICLYQSIKLVRSGSFDYVPPDSDAAYPALQAFIDTMEVDEVFAPYKY